MVCFLACSLAHAGIRPDTGPAFQGSPLQAVPAPDGRVWIATDEGLVVMDGDRRRTFGVADGMPDSAATAVAIDADGDVWVGTERGLGWVDGDRVVAVEGVPGPIYAFGSGPGGRTVVGVQGVPYAAVVDVTEDGPGTQPITLPDELHVRDAVVLSSGRFLVGTNDGLHVVDDGTLELVPGTEGTKAGPFVQDGDALFFATGRGVARYDGRSLVRWLPDAYVTGLVRAGDSLFVGTGDGELYRISAPHDEAQPELVGTGPPQSLFSLAWTSGLVFGATWGGGLVRYDPTNGAFDVFRAEHGVASGIVRRLLVDREDALWITTDAGVQTLTDFAVDTLGAAELGSDDVSAVVEVAGRIIAGTGAGVAVQVDGGWARFTRADGLSSTSVTELVVIDDRRVLLAGPGHGEGVSWLHLDEAGPRVEPVTAPWGRPDPRWGHSIGALPTGGWLVERHSDGTVLEVAPDGTLVREDTLDDGGFLNGATSDGQQAWLATTAGIHRWDEGMVAVDWPLRDLDVSEVVPVADGAWVVYARPLGLDRVGADGRRSWTRSEGMPSDRVSWVHPRGDDAWVGTGAGVVRVEGDQVVEVLTTRDGLPSDRSADGLVDAHGVLWVATSSGLARRTPWRGSATAEIVDLQVDATLDGRALAGSTTTWDARRLVARLDVRTAVDRAALRFRWRLEPGGAWSPWTAERTIRSTGLDAGRQTLQVEARSAAGDIGRWSATFTVLPPWYRRPPVVVGAVLSPFVILGLWAWWRMRRIASERDRLEQEVLARTAELRVLAGDLAAQSEAKSRYLADMSHELRTPLNAIIGYTELLAEEARDEGATALLPDMDRVETAARHLLGLINDVLDLSKIEAGRIELKMTSVDLAVLTHEVVTTLQPIAADNGNDLVSRVPEATTVRADAQRVRQILTNLIGNACKFTSEGVVTVSVESHERRIDVVVADTGIGMTPTELGRLFQPFAQANQSTSEQYGGTGLGLVISRELADAMGGSLTATSTRGEGSRFILALPVPF